MYFIKCIAAMIIASIAAPLAIPIAKNLPFLHFFFSTTCLSILNVSDCLNVSRYTVL